ncbi:hypothetical protein [Rhizobium lentis]|uniref:Uncharacterized protein n=1 Tax=Rhizobium lentis TaxID=1138194 RepID=A0A7W8XE98_9HYPH|nr:hypothetical protein [Rhizobium lentis]MBB4574401.1 hypothetical protein [Rhizobium lentis]MBB5550327.1 hypothetical protein [Rhizobium lentis]MBB5560644.1 hypothetical protein [Rhizobium lentis]MBB5567229.1 hypothetical protein [Rhizobium lentis]
MIALAVLIATACCALGLLVKQAPAKQVAEGPVISDKQAVISRAQCMATGPIERRIFWIVRRADGSVRAFGSVTVRKCGW